MGKPRQLANAASDGGNLTFSGTGNRIVGDFSNGTIANRVMFQTSTTNGTTTVTAIPNGTSATSQWAAWNNSDQTNAAFYALTISNTDARLQTGVTGSGTALPMTFYTGGSERVRIDTAGRVAIGTPSPLTNSLQTLQYDNGTINTALTATGYGIAPSINTRNAGGTAASPAASSSNPINFVGATTSDGTTFLNTVGFVGGIEGTPTTGSHPTFFAVSTTPSGSTTRAERMRIDSSGNVGIGTSSPASKLNVANGSITLTDGYGYTWGNTYITGYAGNYMAFATNGSERARIDSSGNFLFNSGYGSVATAYGCRAWVNFNGTGANGTNQTIRGSGNVSSVSKTSSGVYVMNFATAMPDTNYAALGTAIAGSAPAAPLNDTIGAYSFNTGNLGFQCTDGTSNTFTNPVFASIAIIR